MTAGGTRTRGFVARVFRKFLPMGSERSAAGNRKNEDQAAPELVISDSQCQPLTHQLCKLRTLAGFERNQDLVDANRSSRGRTLLMKFVYHDFRV
jgi:hypothetical protein